MAGLAAAARFDPLAEGCLECPENLVMVASDPGAQRTVTRWGLAAGAAGLAVVVAVIVVRLARSSSARRLREAPVLLAAIAFVSLSAVQFAHGVRRGFVSNDEFDRLLWTSQALALLLLAVATALGPTATASRAGAAGQARRRARRRAAPWRLARRARGRARRPRPAAALQDRRKRVGAPDGTPAGAPGGDATQLVAGDRVVGALVHRPGLLDDPTLRDELGSARTGKGR